MGVHHCYSRRWVLVLIVSILAEQGLISAFLGPLSCKGSPVALTRGKVLSPRTITLNAAKESEEKGPAKKPRKKKPKKKTGSKSPSSKGPSFQKKKEVDKDKKKEVIAKAAKELLRKDTPSTSTDDSGNLLNILDPFKAGKKLRKTIDTALTNLGTKGLSEERRSIYYLDDRLTEQGGTLFGAERNPLFDRLAGNDYVPEVLVVGATGEVGRLVVRRLLLDGRFRVRVLVRNLYSKTLNLLGTGVTYCQGDLSDVESLEYALTDVDKIVFCAGAPKPDESDFQDRFQEFVEENLEKKEGKDGEANGKAPIQEKEIAMSDKEWSELESVLELRSKLAEQVDCIGMQNLVRAYQNVRVADYGTSQAAKRSLFKFYDRPEDFNLFAIDDEDDIEEEDMPAEITHGGSDSSASLKGSGSDDYSYDDDEYQDNYGEDEDAYYASMADKYDDVDDPYADYEGQESADEYATATSRRAGSATKTQCRWVKSKFGNGVFVGKVPALSAGGGGEAAVVSSRLRSRNEADPEAGIDLSTGFGGFICRVCSDGGNYEAFVRTREYETDGVEYVCEFSTSTKPTGRGNKSKNKFKTIRLDFNNFKPVQRHEGGDEPVVPPFRGQDVRQLGFRFRSESNMNGKQSMEEKNKQLSFYLSLLYIKVFRSQPEPEFIYLSDARIPPVIKNGMVRHEAKRLVTTLDSSSEDGGAYRILDEAEMKRVAQDRKDRSGEETYYKYRGEEILKNSGLSYAIIRVSGYNELPTSDASSIELQSSNGEVSPVSRADVAQVCASALLDPNALNKSFYIRKAQKSSRVGIDDDLSAKFKALPTDASR